MSTCEFLNNSNYPSYATAPRSQSWFGLLEFEKTVFVLVNLMDVVMTSLLLSTGSFYESNPIADYFIQGWGLVGMTAFKLVLVGFVLAITNLVAIWKIDTARNVLYFGIATVGTVVAYSVSLLMFFGLNG